MAANKLDSSMLEDDAVTGAKLATGAVGTTDIANDAVTGAKLNPSLVTGDIIYSDGTDSIERLAKPASPVGEVLTFATSATAPSWVAPAVANYDGDRAYVYRDTSNQSISNNTWTKIQLNGEVYDPNSNFDPSTNYRYTAPANGTYLVYGHITWEGLNDEQRSKISIYKNGVTEVTGELVVDVGEKSQSIAVILALSTSDYLELWCWQSTGVAENISYDTQGKRTYITVYRLG